MRKSLPRMRATKFHAKNTSFSLLLQISRRVRTFPARFDRGIYFKLAGCSVLPGSLAGKSKIELT